MYKALAVGSVASLILLAISTLNKQSNKTYSTRVTGPMTLREWLELSSVFLCSVQLSALLVEAPIVTMMAASIALVGTLLAMTFALATYKDISFIAVSGYTAVAIASLIEAVQAGQDAAIAACLTMFTCNAGAAVLFVKAREGATQFTCDEVTA